MTWHSYASTPIGLTACLPSYADILLDNGIPYLYTSCQGDFCKTYRHSPRRRAVYWDELCKAERGKAAIRRLRLGLKAQMLKEHHPRLVNL